MGQKSGELFILQKYTFGYKNIFFALSSSDNVAAAVSDVVTEIASQWRHTIK